MHAILDNTWTFQFHLNYSVDNKTAKLKEKREKRTDWGKGSRQWMERQVNRGV